MSTQFTLFIFLQLLTSSISKIQPNPEIEFPCKPPHHNTYQFCNTTLSITARAHSLISLLTLQEKIQQLCNNATSIPRLGIPPYQWWSESLHGIATNGPGVSFNGSIPSATSFPQVIVTASAFNRSLWFDIAKAIAVEARAMYNVGQAGLTFWAPNINIFRDPRWGRGSETPGEDPMVASAYAVEFVRGFQGQNLKGGGGIGIGFGEKRALRGDGGGGDDGLMLSACCKHFTAYDLESWGNFTIDQGKVQEQDIDRALVNLFLVQLRLGLFDGDPAKGQFGKLGPQDVCTTGHKTLALEAARQGIVLLKNDRKFLPLDKNGIHSLAIIGPMANDASKLGGGYSGVPCNPKSISEELQAYAKKASYAAGCLDVPCDSDAGFDEAVLIAKEADYVIVVAGLDLSQETEDHDRISLLLPGKQMALVSSVVAASRRPIVLVLTGGGPLDVSFAKGDPRIASIIWIGYPGEAGGKALAEVIFGKFNPAGRLPMTWYPESFTSVPMNDMSMRADPSRGYPGRTYRFYTGDRLYGFGEGLSYTSFTYKFLSAPSKISLLGSSKAYSTKNILHQREYNLDHIHIDEVDICDSLKVFVQTSVMNIGDMDGSHVVMLYARVPKIFQSTPEKQLVGFNRVHTISYGSTETSILVDPCKHLSIANEQGKRILPLGNHILILGDLQHYISIQT